MICNALVSLNCKPLAAWVAVAFMRASFSLMLCHPTAPSLTLPPSPNTQPAMNAPEIPAIYHERDEASSDIVVSNNINPQTPKDNDHCLCARCLTAWLDIWKHFSERDCHLKEKEVSQFEIKTELAISSCKICRLIADAILMYEMVSLPLELSWTWASKSGGKAGSQVEKFFSICARTPHPAPDLPLLRSSISSTVERTPRSPLCGVDMAVLKDYLA